MSGPLAKTVGDAAAAASGYLMAMGTAATIDGILNWRVGTPEITLSGQPSEAQLRDLADAGVTEIVNLGPHDNNGALPDEPGSVAALGMTYHYIPVDFENPTEHDYQAFCNVLAKTQGKLFGCATPKTGGA